MFKIDERRLRWLAESVPSRSDEWLLSLLRSSFPEADESSHGRSYFRFRCPMGFFRTGVFGFFRINDREDGRWSVQTYGDRGVESVLETDVCLGRLIDVGGAFAREFPSGAEMRGRGFHCKFRCGSLSDALRSALLWQSEVSEGVHSLCGGLERFGRRGILESCDRLLSSDRAFATGMRGLETKKGDKRWR